jgi:hypothetical protein
MNRIHITAIRRVGDIITHVKFDEYTHSPDPDTMMLRMAVSPGQIKTKEDFISYVESENHNLWGDPTGLPNRQEQLYIAYSSFIRNDDTSVEYDNLYGYPEMGDIHLMDINRFDLLKRISKSVSDKFGVNVKIYHNPTNWNIFVVTDEDKIEA